LTFEPSSAEVEEPGNADLTASWSATGQSSSPYDVRIVDEDGTPLASCPVSGNTHCDKQLGGWQQLREPLARTLRAQVVDGETVLDTVETTVTFTPHEWDLTLTPSATEVEVDPEDGSASVGLESTVSDSEDDSPYDVRIVDADNGDALLGACRVYGNEHCGGSASGTGLGADPTRHFRAEVVLRGDETPFATATTEVYFHHPDYAVDGINIHALAGSYDDGAVCVALNDMKTAPKTDSLSLNDYQKACLAYEAAGLTTEQIIARLGTAAGGAAILAFLTRHATPGDGPNPQPPPLAQPYPPATLPTMWDMPIAAGVARMSALDPSSAYTDADLEIIVRQCLWAAAGAEIAFSNCGRKWLPIFVTGEQNPTGTSTRAASQHDLDALGRFPGWFKLNKETKPRTQWYASDLDCEGRSADLGLDCDEFPFQSTEQGGPNGILRTGRKPDLEVISASANRAQGSYLELFYDACALRTGTPQPEGHAINGDQFLVVPIPVGITTGWFCNGKTLNDQPPVPWTIG
jgi:hypothetical protein